MTRTERLAQKLARQREALAAQRRDVAQTKAAVRASTRKSIDKRRYHVGALAHEAGLFAWSDADLASLFALLATLEPCPNPVAVLEALLSEHAVSLAPLATPIPCGHGVSAAH